MNPIDIEQYKKDMMRLYGRRTPSDDTEENNKKTVEDVPTEKPVETPSEISTELPTDTPLTKITGNNDNSETATSSTENDTLESIEERFPEPELLSELESEELPPVEYNAEESLGSSTGYILVNVRAGNNAYPIVNASVIVTAIVDGNRLLISSGNTDISGATVKLQTPAPSAIFSQSPHSEVRPYSLFDISVVADGYFNARSVDVPVFSGVTSIQNFNMIPVPLLMNSNDETLTYFNQEPDYR